MTYDPPKFETNKDWNKDRSQPTIWMNVAETKSEFSDLRVNFKVPEGVSLDANTQRVAWRKWREDWGKWTGALKPDEREAPTDQAAGPTPGKSTGTVPDKDIPF